MTISFIIFAIILSFCSAGVTQTAGKYYNNFLRFACIIMSLFYVDELVHDLWTQL